MKSRQPRSKAKPSPKVLAEDLTLEEGSTHVDPVISAKPMWQRWDEKGNQWETYELLPYLPSVEDLWHRLSMADIHLPMADVMTNLDAFTGCAKKLLYLLSHQAWQYRHLRSDPQAFVEEVERWADVNVPRAKNMELVTLMLRIHNRAHQDDAATL